MEKKESPENMENGTLKADNSSFLWKIPKHNWALATYVLGFLCIFLLILSLTGSNITGRAIGELSLSETSQQVEGFISEELLQGMPAEVIDIKEVSGVYVATISFEGEQIPIYVTKDGYFISQGMDLVSLDTRTNVEPVQEQPIQQPGSIELKPFNDCLAENGLKIYGADWCGFCRQVVETLGGYEAVEAVYVECTEPQNEAICSEKVDRGYPTIRLNGEIYSGARTLEAFSEATGCALPN